MGRLAGVVLVVALATTACSGDNDNDVRAVAEDTKPPTQREAERVLDEYFAIAAADGAEACAITSRR